MTADAAAQLDVPRGNVIDGDPRMDLVLRRATAGDAARLFAWANDPETRLNSFNHEPIAWETHVAWLDRRLADPETFLWIAELDGEPVGTVRLSQEVPRGPRPPRR